MARPEKYTDQDFIDWINAEVSKGRKLQDISAGEVQAGVGGKYIRCQSILTSMLEAEAEKQQEVAPTMPAWFKAFVAEVESQARQAAESQWLTIGKSIKDSIDEAASVYEEKRQALEAQDVERLAQIELLEKSSDAFSEELDLVQGQLSETLEVNAELKTRVAALSEQVVGLKESRSDLRESLRNEESKKVAVENENQKLREKIESLMVQLSDAKFSLDNATKELDAVSADRDKLTEQLATKVAEIANQKDQLVELKSEVKSLSKELDAKQSELGKSDELVKAKDQELIETRRERDTALGQLRAVEQQLKDSSAGKPESGRK